MAEIIIGRKAEQELLLRKLNSNEPELLAVFGRRRVGKTYLIRQVYATQMVFELNGLHNASNAGQLQHFAKQLFYYTKKKKDKTAPPDWMEAFEALQLYLEGLSGRSRKVIFFDELPWLAGRKSSFLTAFTQFWNGWATRRKDIVVVICGSAASWMIQKIVNNKGGLHNRITARVRLEPFTLHETEQYLQYKKIKLDRYQILQLYMVMGGIPHYLNEVENGYSAEQNIDKICFKKDGLLLTEYNNLFTSLFDKAERHEAVMRALAQKPKGLDREGIIKIAKLSAGGGTTKVLTELQESGFIAFQPPYNRQFKNGIYRITDEYSLFYIKFIEGNRYSGAVWSKISRLPSGDMR